MDAIDTPDHGEATYMSNGTRVVQRGFDPDKAMNVSGAPPEGGPVFPALEDVQISSVPT